MSGQKHEIGYRGEKNVAFELKKNLNFEKQKDTLQGDSIKPQTVNKK